MEKKELNLAELGIRFRDVRVRLGLTQTNVALQTGVPQSILSKIERGGSVVSSYTFPLLVYYSEHISLNYMFSPDFDIANDDALFNRQYRVNSVIGARLEMIQDEFNKEMTSLRDMIQKSSFKDS